jgi:hypothetical protein
MVSFEKLVKVKRPKRQEYSIFAYIVCDTTTDRPELPVGYVINLGNFATPEEASKRAIELIEITGYKGICAGPSNQWFDLSTNNVIDRTRYVTTSSSGKDAVLREQQLHKANDELRKQKERAVIERDIVEERERSSDPTSVEAYTYNWYALVKSRALMEYHRKHLEDAEAAYTKRETLIRELHSTHPEHDTTFLPLLKEKLTVRQELHVYDAMEKGHAELRDSILG